MVFRSLVLLCGIASNLSGFKLGLENISDEMVTYLKKKRVGLITNQTGHDQRGIPTHEILLKKEIPIVALFAPEHGFYGKHAAADEIKDSVETISGIPIYSLYGKGTGKDIPNHHLEKIDVFIFDMQDAGIRHYTYISTLFNAMKSAMQANKYFIVLDRPNPLGCIMEGPLVESHLSSFISIAPIPLRYGMTIGELARYFNEHLLEKKTKLYVVPMNNYVRHAAMPSTLNPYLSPNITHIDACKGYSFLGLLGEIRPFDVGIATPKAFQCLMIPEAIHFPQQQWHELAELLQKKGLASQFSRYYSSRKKKQMVGLEFMIHDVNSISSWEILLTIIAFFKKKNMNLECSAFFDKAVGTPLVRKYIDGTISKEKLQQIITHDIKIFFEKVRPIFVYAPHPKIGA